ncbi:MAG: hypothetical protein ACXVY8_05110 [Gaiellaceae bacterium]
MPALRRPTPQAWRILGAAAACALLLQLLIVAGTLVPHHLGPGSSSDSMLLIRTGTLGDVAGILEANGAWLAAVTLLAWPIARLWSWSLDDSWDPAWVNRVARGVYPAVAATLLLVLWWIFSAQARTLSEGLVARWALFATFLHGTLEFTALLLPLCAAASCIRAPAARPGRRLLISVAVAAPLLISAAAIEVYVSPRLLAPLTA